MAKQRQALGKGLGALIPGSDDATIVSEIQTDGRSTLVIQVSVDTVEDLRAPAGE